MAFVARSRKIFGVAVGAATVGALAYSKKQKPLMARNWTSNAHLKYPASCNYPDLSKHNNTMADCLTPKVYILTCITSLPFYVYVDRPSHVYIDVQPSIQLN